MLSRSPITSEYVMRRRPSTLIILTALVLIIGGVGIFLGTRSLQGITVLALINLMVVLSLFVFIGNSGVFSFGHVAFMAVGAYLAAVLVMPAGTKELLHPDMPGLLRNTELAWPIATMIGGSAAALVAFLVSIPVFRAPPTNAALATFAFLLVAFVILNNWVQVTNGTGGLSGIPTIDNEIVLVGAIILLAGAWWFTGTSTCRRLRASREDEPAAQALGVRIARERRIAFTVSAFMIGIAGALFAQTQGSISPTQFFIPLTFLTLAMLVVGGTATLSGGVAGVILISIVSEILARGESGLYGLPELPLGTREIGVGLLMLLVLTTRPAGLMAGKEVTFFRKGSRSLKNASQTVSHEPHESQTKRP